MVRYKRTARRGTLAPDARAFLRSLYAVPPPPNLARSIVTEESRVVGPIVISDDEEIAATPPYSSVPVDPSDPMHEFLCRLDEEEDRALPLQPACNILQPPGPSAPTADPSLSSNDALRLMQIRQELADLRREINALHADIAKAVEDNKL